eukprot:c20493_g2_i9.p1 GENE.c20493_g2_i9~~c20493_g2_i9.p1  ORF type:complete len:132 (+),score=27.43 c20493_g2_i9:144-539(+)
MRLEQLTCKSHLSIKGNYVRDTNYVWRCPCSLRVYRDILKKLEDIFNPNRTCRSFGCTGIAVINSIEYKCVVLAETPRMESIPARYIVQCVADREVFSVDQNYFEFSGRELQKFAEKSLAKINKKLRAARF